MISPEYSLKAEALVIGHLMRRTNSLEKTLMLVKIQGKRKSRWQRTRWSDGITDSMGMILSKLQVLVMDSEAWHAPVLGFGKSWTWMSYWTELDISYKSSLLSTNSLSFCLRKSFFTFGTYFHRVQNSSLWAIFSQHFKYFALLLLTSSLKRSQMQPLSFLLYR